MVDASSEETRVSSGLVSLLQTPTEASSKRGTKRDHGSMNSEASQQDSQQLNHNATMGTLPRMTTNHPSYRSAERIAASIPEEIQSIIQENSYTDEDFEFLKAQAGRGRKIYKCGEIRIGLKGDSGTGKSSLINALLGYDGIAPCGDYGEACTAVVQEFRKPRPSQQTPCEAEVTFLLPQAREAALKDWLANFWDSHKSGTDEDEEGEFTAEGVDDEVQSGEGFATASDAIYSLFADHEECKNAEATKDFLSSTAASREDPHLLRKLGAWTEKLLKGLGVESGELVIRAPTPEDLRDSLAQFLAHVDRERPSPWPLVKLVKCYFDSPLLSQDVVLADLPGTSDVNKTRVQATNAYMRDVDHTGVVAKIERVQTDTATHKSLIEAYKRKRGPNVFLAVTHSDSGISNAAGLVDKYLHMPNASATDVKKLSQLKEQFEMIKLDLESLESQKKQALSKQEYELFGELQKQSEALESRKTDQQDDVTAICLKIRNDKVRKALRDRHYHMLKQEILPVFCISSLEYLKHINGYDNDHPPTMSVEATEVPELRAYVYSLPDKRKSMAFRHHVKYGLPSLLNSVAMTCSQTKLRRRDELQHILLGARKPIAESISQVFQDLLSDEVISRLGKIKKNKAVYITAAREKLKVYSKKAFFLNRGNWKTAKVGAHNWNVAMTEPLINDMKVDLRPWDDVSEPLGRSLSEKVVGALQALITDMEDSAGPSHDVLLPFFDELRLQVDQLDMLCKSEAQKVENGLRLIKESLLLEADPKDGFFIQALEKSYNEIAAMGGTGVSKKRMGILESKISEKGATNPFHKCHDKAKTAGQKLIAQHREEFTNRVMEVFANFHEMFMRLFRTDESDTPEAKALRKKLRDRLPAFRTEIAKCERLLQESLEDDPRH
ncbi:hypothetical protein SLS54_005302 [Diplodia seriata]